MSTTTIRLPDELKTRVAAVAEALGATSHAFILEAIEEKTALAERQADFRDEAERRYAELVDTGKTVPWSEMRRHLEQRLAGPSPRRPRARKLER